MRSETDFGVFLGGLSAKAARSRIARAKRVEKELDVDLDDVVSSDAETFRVLTELAKRYNHHRNLSNAVRKYYLFKNGKEFPRLKDY